MRLLCAFALVAAFGIGAGPAAADCAAPEASFTPPLSPKAAAPGETIRFEGEYWATECNDTVVCSNGCFRDACTEGEAPPRADSIAIEIRRAGGPPIMLVEGLDADEEYRHRRRYGDRGLHGSQSPLRRGLATVIHRAVSSS
jgi:hypothetical protein